MRHKILLPTDLSDNAWHAIQYAIELFKNEATDFYILNVFSAGGNIVENLMNPQSGTDLYELKKEESEKGLAKLLDQLILGENSNPKHQFKVLSKFSHTIDAIKEIVDKKDISLMRSSSSCMLCRDHGFYIFSFDLKVLFLSNLCADNSVDDL